ncbi:MAG: choice-of-anchor G family protein, partial [Nocardioidaceae bacterium]
MRTKRVGVKLAATAGVVAVAMTAFAPAAAAASADRSAAKARFLSGTAGGRSFDTVAALKGVAVERSGDDGKVKQANTFQGSVLGQPLPGQPKGINVPIGDLIKIGAANQYAKASPRAKAVAASGAVANGGAINTTGDTNFPADATLDLAKVPGLPKQVTEQLLDLKLRIGAISSVAAMNA